MCHCYDRLAFFKMFSRVFCFEHVNALIDFWDELYSSEISKDENREQRLKGPFVTTKMLSDTNPRTFSGTRQVCRFVLFCFFLFCSLYKTNRFYVAVGLFSNRSQRTSKCGKTSVILSSTARVPLRCLIFTTVIYY